MSVAAQLRCGVDPAVACLDEREARRMYALYASTLATSGELVKDFRRDSDLFGDGVRDTESRRRIAAAFDRGLRLETERRLSPRSLLTWAPLIRCDLLATPRADVSRSPCAPGAPGRATCAFAL